MIGIVGGTFDPVHNGHIRPVLALASEIAFSKIHYVLSARPPHRTPPRESAAHRYRMLELALSPYPLLEADDREMKRPGPSYTVLTLEDMRGEHGDSPLCLILGADAFLGLQTWHRWQEIAALAHVLVLSRPGWSPGDDVQWSDARALERSASGRVALWRGVEVPVSSTQVRRRLAAGDDVSGQVPAPVLRYIHENGLYGVSDYG